MIKIGRLTVKMNFQKVILTFLGIVACYDCLAAEYGIIIDAGSSGSRARIYTWPERTELTEVIQLREVANKKSKPGLSAFVGDAQGIRNHLSQLIEACKDNVPEEKRPNTPIYLMATAGMRLLTGTDAFAIYQTVNDLLSHKSFSPFDFTKGNARTLSGEEEGAFTWISANQLNGLFGNDRTTNRTVGIMEMGGASTQMAFVPRGSLLADKFPVYVAGKYYPLYVHSYLYYGQDFASKKIKDYIYRMRTDRDATNFSNPCMLVGDQKTEMIEGTNVQFQGTGQADDCLELIQAELVFKVPDYRCYPKPCSIGQVYQPVIPADMIFHAVSAFAFTVKDMNAYSSGESTTAKVILATSREFCKMDLETALNKTGNRFVDTLCFSGLFISTLLTDGWGFGEDRKIDAAGEIADQELTWTPGAMVYEVERRDRGHFEPVTATASTQETAIILTVMLIAAGL
ncbi:unnamed protein product [Owenia fusiformis]|uniref:Uncharacterized protein n=1 Tax=Owenia fusiformis TaxID=6347 RepID=A0A8J1TRH0_OWEFU|nr:unnamed protein product [Owenia fusiformis]